MAGIGWGIVADMAQHVRCNNIVEMKQARSPIVAVILAFGSLPAVKLVASGLALVALFAAVVLYHARVSRWRATANVWFYVSRAVIWEGSAFLETATEDIFRVWFEVGRQPVHSAGAVRPLSKSQTPLVGYAADLRMQCVCSLLQ